MAHQAAIAMRIDVVIVCCHVGVKKQAVQYTIRGVPGEVDRILRERAVREM